MTLRLEKSTREVKNVHYYRTAGRLDHSLPSTSRKWQEPGWPVDGFPPPHYYRNASWHLSTFMTPEQACVGAP